MAKHDVVFTVPWRSLGNADIRFRVKRANKKWGELLVSKGAIVWYPKGKQYGFKLSWAKFDQVMRGNV